MTEQILPTADELDLTALVRPGDLVTWGQACAEPRSLTQALIRQAPSMGGIRCFVGIPAESQVRADTAGRGSAVQVHSYCGAGTNADLHAADSLQVWPLPYSALPDLLTTGPLRADVVLVQVSPADQLGRHSLGLADDYFSAALDTARVVVAEVNEHVPHTPGARTLTSADWTVAVRSSEPPGCLHPPEVTAAAARVAERVAAVVPDGATVQAGIGALPDAVLDRLHGHRELGLHSGILTDAAMRLVESGVATGSQKTHDRGVAVGGLLGGTDALFAWAHRNPRVTLRPTAYTHDATVLATSHRLVAVNAAIEVDLTGAVNSEVAAGRYVGAVGGATDFLRGAARSPGGIPVIALPSTARGASRVVSRLNGPTSTPRSEPLVVVTEHGVADLRGLPLQARIERMIAVADPEHQPELDASADGVLAAAR